MSVAFLVIGIVLLLISPMTWFSSQWTPAVVNWWRRVRHHVPRAALPVSNQPDNDLERFRACLPHIEQCRKLVQPFAGPLGSIDMALQQLSDGGSRIQELIQSLVYLTRKLETLGIRCPIFYGGNDESDSTFRIRLRIWAMHLTDLVVMIRNDDLASARLIEPLEPAKQPTSDRSDAQF